MQKGILNFNLRVYGIVINNGYVLISNETRFGVAMQKFPGGGIEFGEGIEEALRREFKEELNVEIKRHEFLYVNDFFQQSSFVETDQLISFYYLVEVEGMQSIHRLVDGKIGLELNQSFIWVDINSLDLNDLTFPIDQKVASILKEKNAPNK